MRLSKLCFAPLALAVFASDVTAQDRTAREAEARARAERDRAEARGGSTIVYRSSDDSDRAVLGINTGSSGDRDTLGLLITSVTPGGPAEKAGIEEGNRIASINGVNLRLSREDAGERDMQGLTSRRLTREMGKLKAGDEVELRVWQSGAYKNVKVKTIAADELSTSRSSFTSRSAQNARPVVGISLGSSGSKRDTLGVLVIGVTEAGPAEKAGIIEGDRIQSVNGVNLRVSSEDAGDSWMSQARAQRLRRELSEASVGERLEMRVWSGGQVKTVSVVPVRSDSLFRNDRESIRMFFGESGMFPTPPMPPMAPMPPMPPRIMLDGEARYYIDGSVQRALEAVRAPRFDARIREAMEHLETIRVAPQPRIRIIPRDQIVTEPSPAPVAVPTYGARLAAAASFGPATATPVAMAPAKVGPATRAPVVAGVPVRTIYTQ